MKIKKFKAKTFTEALELVKKEFSEDAIILSTEEKKGIRSFVEITAAFDYEMGSSKAENTPVSRTRKREELQYSGSEEGIKLGIRNLSDMSLDVKKHDGINISLPAHKKMIFHFLKEISVKEEFALRLCENANDLNDIPSLLSSDIRTRAWNTVSKSPKRLRGRAGYTQAVMLIGPTGVGKTTTMAKLSAHALREGRKVAIISLDTYRIGAVEQVRIYSKIMGIPFAIASNVRELQESLTHFGQSRDTIFIDTSGRNPRDEMYINDLIEVSQLKFPHEIHLLMSASCDNDFMAEAYQHYCKLPIDCIAFTKVDEAVQFGSLYNILVTSQKPVVYITTGQKVPDDIEFVTVNKLTNLILKKGCYEC